MVLRSTSLWVLGWMLGILGVMACQDSTVWASSDNSDNKDTEPLLDSRYAEPFGFRPDVLLQNHARFGYFFNGGEIYGRSANENGGYASLTLAMKDFIGLEIASKWTSGVQQVIQTQQPCYAEVEETCKTRFTSYRRSRAELGFTPKFRLPIDSSWFWMNLSAEIRVPINTGEVHEPRMVEVNPGFQMYFNAASWFGFELDGQALVFLTDPKESDNRQVVPGGFIRGNFLFKLNKHHFLSLQVDETLWFPDVSSQDETDAEDFLRFNRTPGDNLTESQRIAMLFPSTNLLSAGGGYQLRYGLFNGGIGALYHITDSDARHLMSLFVDLRFAFN